MWFFFFKCTLGKINRITAIKIKYCIQMSKVDLKKGKMVKKSHLITVIENIYSFAKKMYHYCYKSHFLRAAVKQY